MTYEITLMVIPIEFVKADDKTIAKIDANWSDHKLWMVVLKVDL